MKPTTSVKPGNHIATTTIASSNHKMKYLSGQRESYSLGISSRKRFLKRKLMYVTISNFPDDFTDTRLGLCNEDFFLPAKPMAVSERTCNSCSSH